MKAVILGTSCAGKTSAGNILAEKYTFSVIDVDDEARKVKSDIFYDRDEAHIDEVFETTNQRVLRMDNAVFTTSFLEPERVVEFHNKGFKIIHLYASLEETIKRRTKRHGGFLSEERLKRVKNNHKHHMKIANSSELNKLIGLTLDTTNLTTEETADKILKFLGK